MEWLANLVTRGALAHYKTCHRQADEEAEILKEQLESAENRLLEQAGRIEQLESDNSRLSVQEGRADHYRKRMESYRSDVQSLREQLNQSNTRVRELEEVHEAMTARSDARIDRLERVNYFLSKNLRQSRIDLSRQESDARTSRYISELFRRRSIEDERRLQGIIAERDELIRRVAELMPFRLRRDENGRFLPREASEEAAEEKAA